MRRWLIIAMSLVPNTADADAAAILKHLSETPATLLELSIARIDALLTAVGEKHGFGAYAWPQDGGVQIFAYADTLPRTEAACRGVVEAIRNAGGINPKTGVPDQPASAYASMFNYPGLDQFKIDQSYAETADGMIRLRVTIGSSGDGKAMGCQAPLVNGGISYKRE
jgi:hypothetical protein